MSQELVTAAVRLADVLQRENRALAAIDLVRAAGLLDEKRAAFDAFALAQAMAETTVARPDALAVATRLRGLAAENRTLLERAIAAQSRVIGIIARAVPPGPNPRYAANGALAQPGRPVALALSARA